ncbi:GNAT family N-acetyltransferase [Tropicimonas marinistellae]|uniref:GNAT family N-acetyltransferase n=1 Tax=Tropicimonas marinistellae TaxID=1739787 RepID=UPI000832AF33|nr:GNAT family N-acetyltransferase [Tropicimonas marinistellae]
MPYEDMPDIRLRPCEARDIAAVQAIYADAVLTGLASFELEAPTVEEMQARWTKITAAGFPFLVAERGGELSGFAYAAAYRERPAYAGTVEDSVYVDRRHRGAGIGRMLLAEVIAHCETGGFRQMIAVIGDSGNAGSVALHQRLGFDHVGTFRSVGWKHGRWLDTVLMQRSLGAGDTAPPQI